MPVEASGPGRGQYASGNRSPRGASKVNLPALPPSPAASRAPQHGYRVQQPRQQHQQADAASSADDSPPLPSRVPQRDSRLVFARIGVLWPEDSVYYKAAVVGYNASKRKHRVRYDDGAEEWLALGREQFKWLCPRGRSAGADDLLKVELNGLRAVNVPQTTPPVPRMPKGSLRAGAENPPVGQAAVGRRVAVYCPVDGEFYRAEIVCFDRQAKRHHALYEDGEDEWLALAEEKCTWPRSQRGGKKQQHAQQGGAGGAGPPLSVGLKKGRAMPKGRKAIGWKVGVYRVREMCFQEGHVVGYDAASGKHLLRFDAGGKLQHLVLAHERVKWVFPPQLETQADGLQGTEEEDSSEEEGQVAGEARGRVRGRQGMAEEDDEEQEQTRAHGGGSAHGGTAGGGSAGSQPGGGRGQEEASAPPLLPLASAAGAPLLQGLRPGVAVPPPVPPGFASRFAVAAAHAAAEPNGTKAPLPLRPPQPATAAASAVRASAVTVVPSSIGVQPLAGTAVAASSSVATTMTAVGRINGLPAMALPKQQQQQAPLLRPPLASAPPALQQQQQPAAPAAPPSAVPQQPALRPPAASVKPDPAVGASVMQQQLPLLPKVALAAPVLAAAATPQQRPSSAPQPVSAAAAAAGAATAAPVQLKLAPPAPTLPAAAAAAAATPALPPRGTPAAAAALLQAPSPLLPSLPVQQQQRPVPAPAQALAPPVSTAAAPSSAPQAQQQQQQQPASASMPPPAPVPPAAAAGGGNAAAPAAAGDGSGPAAAADAEEPRRPEQRQAYLAVRRVTALHPLWGEDRVGQVELPVTVRLLLPRREEPVVGDKERAAARAASCAVAGARARKRRAKEEAAQQRGGKRPTLPALPASSSAALSSAAPEAQQQQPPQPQQQQQHKGLEAGGDAARNGDEAALIDCLLARVAAAEAVLAIDPNSIDTAELMSHRESDCGPLIQAPGGVTLSGALPPARSTDASASHSLRSQARRTAAAAASAFAAAAGGEVVQQQRGGQGQQRGQVGSGGGAMAAAGALATGAQLAAQLAAAASAAPSTGAAAGGPVPMALGNGGSGGGGGGGAAGGQPHPHLGRQISAAEQLASMDISAVGGDPSLLSTLEDDVMTLGVDDIDQLLACLPEDGL